MTKISYLIAGVAALSAGVAVAQTPQAQAMQQSQMPGMSSTGAAGAQATTPAAGQPAAGAVQAASATDVKAGAPVMDTQGGTVGTIESVTGDNAVLSTGTVRVQLAVSSFGKSDKGLVISMTKAQVEAEAAKAGGTGS